METQIEGGRKQPIVDLWSSNRLGLTPLQALYNFFHKVFYSCHYSLSLCFVEEVVGRLPSTGLCSLLKQCEW